MKKLSFAEALARLEEIVAEVQKKDTDIEKSLELLEEGIRVANYCTERTDVIEEAIPEEVSPGPSKLN